MEKRLRKSQDRLFAGVCAGLAEYLGLDALLVRLLFVVLTLASGGLFALAYLVLVLIMPDSNAPRPADRALPSADPTEESPPPTRGKGQPREGGDTKLLGWILLGVGAYFLLQALGWGRSIGKLWPLLLIVVGIALLWPHFRSGRGH
ncbi:MAG: PspC domain-containing protein [Chloroflexia bacterium]|nr:PspC domain-containing protein [Chloroflexia bacterium]